MEGPSPGATKDAPSAKESPPPPPPSAASPKLPDPKDCPSQAHPSAPPGGRRQRGPGLHPIAVLGFVTHS